jgi:hypothetical protein
MLGGKLKASLVILPFFLAGCANRSAGQGSSSGEPDQFPSWTASDSQPPPDLSRHSRAEARADAGPCGSDNWCAQYFPKFKPEHIWGSGPSDIFAVSYHQVFHSDGSSWSEISTGLANRDLRDIWGSGPTDVYVVGEEGTTNPNCTLASAIHYDGVKWKSLPSFSLAGGCCSPPTMDFGSSFKSVWGSGASDVYFIGSCTFDMVFHFDGATWKKLSFPFSSVGLQSIWGSGPSDVFSIAGSNDILHYDGNSWSDQATKWQYMQAIWGSGSSDVFVVLAYGYIIHYDGATWSEMKSGTSEDLYGVWGSGASDVYAVGSNGIIIHYDGKSWSAQASGTGTDWMLLDVWGSGPHDVYIVGYHYDNNLGSKGGVILHRSQ